MLDKQETIIKLKELFNKVNGSPSAERINELGYHYNMAMLESSGGKANKTVVFIMATLMYFWAAIILVEKAILNGFINGVALDQLEAAQKILDVIEVFPGIEYLLLGFSLVYCIFGWIITRKQNKSNEEKIKIINQEYAKSLTEYEKVYFENGGKELFGFVIVYPYDIKHIIDLMESKGMGFKEAKNIALKRYQEVVL